MATVRYALFTCVGIGCLLLGAPPAAAQTAPSTAVKVAEDPATATVADIVVTAEHRETSVQSTPIAITALASETLDRANVETVERLIQLTPSMHYNDVSGESFLSIRSVGGEPHTTVRGRRRFRRSSSTLTGLRCCGARRGLFTVETRRAGPSM